MFRIALSCTLILGVASGSFADSLRIDRLTWAGVKFTTERATVFVDAVGDLWDGEAPEGFVAPEAETERRYALVTHVHNDHFDVDLLRELLGERGYVVCHESVATYIASRGLRVIPAALYEPISRSGFLFTAVPAADGFGDEQVSWIVAVQERRFIHAGDTIWHGKFDLIGRQYGPFEAAFLTINGVRTGGELAIETRATMTPTQAIDAALLLRAERIVPIHFGLDDPPHYVEVEDPLGWLRREAAARSVRVDHLRPGESYGR